MPLNKKEQYDQDQAEMEAAFEQNQLDADNNIEKQARENLNLHESQLGQNLLNKYMDFRSQREMSIEYRWLQDLRQYKSEYDPEIKKRLENNRSKAFIGETKTKVRTFVSRIIDLLFPANGEKNFSIDSTPVPDLHPDAIMDIQEQFQREDGTEITEEDVKQLINEEANRRATAMEREIDDQLSELRYRNIVRDVVTSGSIYGTGILKGPLVKQQRIKKYLPRTGNTKGWVTVDVTKILPSCEHVSVWDIYLDMAARKPEQLREIFQRHLMNKNHLIELMDREDFNSQVIRDYLQAEPNGDAEYQNYENQMLEMNEHGAEPNPQNPKTNRYDVLEYWGFIASEDLEKVGVEIPDNLKGLEVAANIWLLGSYLIKAVISPVSGVKFPYYFYYYDKDESSIYGSGIPTISRDLQKILNASVRAMLDNAAISSGPVGEVNEDLLDPDDDARSLHANKIFKRTGRGAEAANPALRVYSIPNYVSQYMQMTKFFMTLFDDVSAIPRFMHGEQTNIGSAGQTVRGLSMLMGAANITLKDQVKNFDEGITKPYIKAHYAWNMEFNDNDDIKGDFGVIPRGSTSLVAREVKVQSILDFLALTANDLDNTYIDREQAIRILEEAMDIEGYGLVKDENRIKKETMVQVEGAEKDKKFQMLLELIKAQSGGHMTPLPPASAKAMESAFGLPEGALSLVDQTQAIESQPMPQTDTELV